MRRFAVNIEHGDELYLLLEKLGIKTSIDYKSGQGEFNLTDEDFNLLRLSTSLRIFEQNLNYKGYNKVWALT